MGAEKKDTETEKDTKRKKQQLSEEDEKIKAELEAQVEKLEEKDSDVRTETILKLKETILSSTSSMTSIPKPLKFLTPHYDKLAGVYKEAKTSTEWEQKTISHFATILSLLSMVQSEDEGPVLTYALEIKESIPFSGFGHEYTVQLQSQIKNWYEKYLKDQDGEATLEKREEFEKRIWPLALESIKYLLDQNSVVEAVDLLVELEKTDFISELIKLPDVQRATLYMINLALINPELGDTLYRLCYDIFMKHEQYAHALRIAMKMDDNDMVISILTKVDESGNGNLLLQLAHMMGRQHFMFDLDQADDFNSVDGEKFIEAAGNANLHQFFRTLLKDLDVIDPKLPSDVYKTVQDGEQMSVKKNLASVFVNGFLNCGSGKDKLLEKDDGKFIYDNKDNGILCAVASFGLIKLWDTQDGFNVFDKYQNADTIQVKAGALLGIGVVSANVRDESEAAWAFLEPEIQKEGLISKTASFALGLAYASTSKEDADTTLGYEALGGSAEQKYRTLAQGLIYAGTMHEDLMSDVITWLCDKDEKNPLVFVKKPDNILPCIAFGLSCLGTKQDSNTALMLITDIQNLEDHIKEIIVHMVKACAYAGTGDVLIINEFLEYLSTKTKDEAEKKKKEKEEAREKEDSGEKEDEKKDDKKDDDEEKEKPVNDEDLPKMIAVIGIALVAMGEAISVTMATRVFGLLFRYGDKAIRRAAPLGLALLHMSNPDLTVTETLSKFTHDSDSVVAQMSILGLGFAGAGTNNARLAQQLRQLAEYYAKAPKQLFCVRFAQGILHLGKGSLTMNPFHSDGLLMHKSALSGLLTTLFCLCIGEEFLQGSSCWILYSLALALNPRMLVTIGEEGEEERILTEVRVGTAVDTVGLAGKPKTITGFQTHKTPVLIASGERAVLASDEYIPLSEILEGVIILKKNPEFKKEDE
jgi:26S proteasome regulatory subunit N1